MENQCKCGYKMSLNLRTLIYSDKVEIENVPILCCDKCDRSEVYPYVKQELTHFIAQLGNGPLKQQVYFQEMNELAHLMYKVSDNEHLNTPLEFIVKERINQLLDLMLLAKSLNDDSWIQDLSQRLIEISKHSVQQHQI